MKFYLHLILCLLLLATSYCKNHTPQKNESKKLIPEWQNLVTSNTFKGWHIYQDNGTKAGWTVENEVFTFDSDLAKGEGDKSLITDQIFTNFEIKFEWMVSENSNSGFMWGVNEEKTYEFPYETGPEIQIIDPQIYRFPLHGSEWDEMVSKSKFANWDGFGKFKAGKICLQDHPGIVK